MEETWHVLQFAKKDQNISHQVDTVAWSRGILGYPAVRTIQTISKRDSTKPEPARNNMISMRSPLSNAKILKTTKILWIGTFRHHYEKVHLQNFQVCYSPVELLYACGLRRTAGAQCFWRPRRWCWVERSECWAEWQQPLPCRPEPELWSAICNERVISKTDRQNDDNHCHVHQNQNCGQPSVRRE